MFDTMTSAKVFLDTRKHPYVMVLRHKLIEVNVKMHHMTTSRLCSRVFITLILCFRKDTTETHRRVTLVLVDKVTSLLFKCRV